MVDLSVIVPTRNRAALLGRVLGLLGEQAMDPARFEVCVVDNASADQTPQVVDLVRAHYPRLALNYVRENRIGVSFARNAGLAQTTGPWIAFLDDDMFPPADWLEHLWAKTQSLAAEDPRLAKVGGEVAPIWAAPRPAWLSDDMLPFAAAVSGLGGAPRYVEGGLLADNGCYRRDALTAVGGFPTTLDRKGGNLLAGGNAVDRALASGGWTLYYDPSILVQHYIHAERGTPAWFRRRYFWQGVTDFALQDYLQDKGAPQASAPAVEMPFDRACWNFINNAAEPPTPDALTRLRGLGYTLAKSGFIPLR